MWSDALLRQEEKDVALHESGVSLAQESREEKADSSKKLDRILELGEVLTIKEIAGRLKLSEKDVFRVLREHDIM